MEIRKLEYFVAVAEELHFGRAAQRMHVSQPPLSQQIRALEQELGVVLFARTSRRVELTPAGQALLEDARDILASTRRAAERVRRVAGGEQGCIRAGFVTPAMDGPLPAVVRAFCSRYPGVRLELAEQGTLQQYEALRTGVLDVGFVRMREEERGLLPGGLDVEDVLLLREDYVLALPPDHALARRSTVQLADLDAQPLIVHPRSTGPHVLDTVFAALAGAGAYPRVAQEAATKRTALALCSAGVGLAIVPRSSAMAYGQGIAVRELGPGLEDVQIRCVRLRKRAHHPASGGLVSLVLAHAVKGGAKA